MHLKLFRCKFYTLNYDIFYTLHPNAKLIGWKSKVLELVKYNFSFIFKGLRKWVIESFYVVLYWKHSWAVGFIGEGCPKGKVIEIVSLVNLYGLSCSFGHKALSMKSCLTTRCLYYLGLLFEANVSMVLTVDLYLEMTVRGELITINNHLQSLFSGLENSM